MATERIFDTQQLHDMVQEAGIVSLLFHGSGSLIHSEDVNGLCQDDLERLLAIACRAYASRAAQQPVQEGADCDQAYEEQYNCSARDPSNAGDLSIWRAAWGAKRVREIAEPCSDHGCAVLGRLESSRWRRSR